MPPRWVLIHPLPCPQQLLKFQHQSYRQETETWYKGPDWGLLGQLPSQASRRSEQRTLEYEEPAVREATGDTQSCLCHPQGECTVNFREDGPSTPANQGHEGWVHGRGFSQAESQGERWGVRQRQVGEPPALQSTLPALIRK